MSISDMFSWSARQRPVFPPLRPVDTGYDMRSPMGGEATYLAQNPQVAGMATTDNAVIFNPAFASHASPTQKQGLYMLESARNHMKTDGAWRNAVLTPQQEAYFRSLNDPYYSKLGDTAKQTLISRIIGGDSIPNAPYTEQQKTIAAEIMKAMLINANRPSR